MKKINPIIQRDFKDCGVCSMEWIIKYYGGFIPLEKLREDTFTDINGTTFYHIINAFKKWGFDCEGVLEHDIKNCNLRFPLIAHLILQNNLEHFVVIKNLNKDTLYIMDPGIGNLKMTIDDFNKLFTGHIVQVYPRDKIINMKEELTINDLFLKIIKEEKFLIIKIIIISILWTLISILCSYYLKIGSNLLSMNVFYLKYLIICFGIFTILKVFFLYVREYYENHLSNLVDVYIYPEFIRHLFFLPLRNVKSRTTGEIVTRINELGNIKSLFSDIFVSCFLDSLMFLISMVILYIINKKLLFILVVSIILYLVLGIIISKVMYKKVLKNINYHTEFNSVIIEAVDMFESVKNLNVIKIILSKIEKCLAKYLLNNYEFSNFINLTNLLKDFILEFSFFLINSYGFWQVYKGGMVILDLFTFNIILVYFIDPVKNILTLLPKYNYVKASFAKISEFVNLEEEKYEDNKSVMKGDIIFNNVSYSYNEYDYILKNVNFKITEGSHVLLNGPSGCGKSTICKILYKVNDITNGEVFIGKNNIKDLNIFTIRNSILYVSQNEELFTGTIKENILLDREVDDNLFWDICKICELDGLVSKKNMRYDSLIESSCKNISGGEKQRIILARGYLKMLILLF